MAKSKGSPGLASSREVLSGNQLQAASRWEALAAPPRPVSVGVRWRLLLGQWSFGTVFALVWGAVPILVGVFFVFFGPPLRWIGLLPLLIGVGVWVGVAVTLISRSRGVLSSLIWGRPARALITHVFDRNTNQFIPYSVMVKQWKEFQQVMKWTKLLGVAGQLRNWPVRMELHEAQGPSKPIEAKIHLGRQLTETVEDPHVDILLDDRGSTARCVSTYEFPWLAVSRDGQWAYSITSDGGNNNLGSSLLRSLLVVVPVYCLAALGITLNLPAPLQGVAGDGLPPWIGAAVVLLFTATHAVVPVFFYYLFLGPLDTAMEQNRRNPVLWFVLGFVHLHMLFWFGIPIVGLAAAVGWITLPWGLLHVAIAGHGKRRWVFLEHGSTSLALLLLMICLAGNPLLYGLGVAAFQALLLTLLDWKARPLWVFDASLSRA